MTLCIYSQYRTLVYRPLAIILRMTFEKSYHNYAGVKLLREAWELEPERGIHPCARLLGTLRMIYRLRAMHALSITQECLAPISEITCIFWDYNFAMQGQR